MQQGRPIFNLANVILDVGKALHFISFADPYIFVSTITSTCPYWVHDLSMSSIIYLFMIMTYTMPVPCLRAGLSNYLSIYLMCRYGYVLLRVVHESVVVCVCDDSL
jgi:hypothetical protein